MFRLWPDKDITVKKAKAGRVPLLILSPKDGAKNAPGVLWIHGGGYVLGMKEMVYTTHGYDPGVPVEKLNALRALGAGL